MDLFFVPHKALGGSLRGWWFRYRVNEQTSCNVEAGKHQSFVVAVAYCCLGTGFKEAHQAKTEQTL
uniref:Uncharacterized protein n=1 Tax=Oryza nivara TaxID=4536 RepID=A0A0E0IGU2_ORYNI